MALEVLLLNILYIFVDAQYARIGYMLEKFKFALKPLEGSDEDVVQAIFLSSVVSQFIIITTIIIIILEGSNEDVVQQPVRLSTVGGQLQDVLQLWCQPIPPDNIQTGNCDRKWWWWNGAGDGPVVIHSIWVQEALESDINVQSMQNKLHKQCSASLW